MGIMNIGKLVNLLGWLNFCILWDSEVCYLKGVHLFR